MRRALSVRRPLLALCVCAALTQAGAAADLLQYGADNELAVPKDYRSWIFLTSSLDLNYDQAVPGAGTSRSLLDNVFVNPGAYARFVQSGNWPDGTVLVKENRLAASAGTISRSGKFQTEVVSM